MHLLKVKYDKYSITTFFKSNTRHHRLQYNRQLRQSVLVVEQPEYKNPFGANIHFMYYVCKVEIKNIKLM